MWHIKTRDGLPSARSQPVRAGGVKSARGAALSRVSASRWHSRERCPGREPNRFSFRLLRKPSYSVEPNSPRCNDDKGTGLPKEVEHWSLTMLRDKLVKIGAKVVRHGRYVTFQLAEVAVPRELFLKILSLIDDLRRRPVPA